MSWYLSSALSVCDLSICTIIYQPIYLAICSICVFACLSIVIYQPIYLTICGI